MALPEDPAAAIEGLRCRYPEWTFWNSGVGRYWATRQEREHRPGCRVTVDADDLHTLEAELFEQEALRSRSVS